jgi:GT2 family glycosyltransferase
VRVGVAIASYKRPQDLTDLLIRLNEQSLPPSRVILSVTGEGDLPSDTANMAVSVIYGAPGLCAQRNRALELLTGDCDVVVFYDDDFVPSRRAIEGVAHLFATAPHIAGATGLVLRDGIGCGGISREAANAIVDDYDRSEHARVIVTPASGTYGCNMAFRILSIGEARFDEALPRYGWQEDIDFSVRVGRAGSIVSTNAFAGVHRGATGGRTPGRALGYSQIVNPIYLVRKGTMSLAYATKLMIRNLIANHVRALRPEPHVDRMGRARGNWLGIVDVLRRNDRPEKILDL